MKLDHVAEFATDILYTILNISLMIFVLKSRKLVISSRYTILALDFIILAIALRAMYLRKTLLHMLLVHPANF